MTEERATFEGWCILELMGHRRLAGWVSEAVVGGGSFVRIDVPPSDAQPRGATQIYAPGAIYCITPTTEDVARRVAATARPEPVQEWELPKKQLAPGSAVVDVDPDGLREKCDHGISVEQHCERCDGDDEAEG